MSTTRTVEYNLPCRPAHNIEVSKILPSEFLVVRHPIAYSQEELVDIYYQTDWLKLMLEAKGGSLPEGIAGIYHPDQHAAAKAHAQRLLKDIRRNHD